MKMKPNFKKLITDVDGIFNNGKFHYSRLGKMEKIFGPHDSDGVKILRNYGLEIFAISADKRGFPITERRMIDMGIDLELVVEKDRYSWVKETHGFENAVYIGDGIWDAALVRDCSYGICPANAINLVKSEADYVTVLNGGEGVMLEVALHLGEFFFRDKLNSCLGEFGLR